MYIAVLIDAENVDPAYAEQIFTYANSIGTVAVKEIYGAGIALNEWANPILQYAIHMNMTLKPNRYKNSSDIALVIGAMDLLAERAAALPEPAEGPEGRLREVQLRNGAPRRIDTIIIASSDSDFSGLSLRLRMAGFEVVGMGNAEKINPSWPVACSSFVAFTPVEHAAQPAQPAQRKPQTPKKEPQPAPPAPKKEQPPVQNVKKEPAPAQQNVKKEPEKGQPQQAAQPKVAPTHSARTEIIRAFITAQIASSGGKLHSTTLLGALHELPDYRYDQQGSKRKPLDYLLRQYGDSFRFEKDPGGFYWIYPPAPPEAKSAEAAPQPQPAAEPAAPAPEPPAQEPPAAPEAVPPAPEPPAEPEKAQEQAVPAPEAVPESVTAPEPEAVPSPAAAFIAAGVPEEDALKIAAIRSEGPNLRVVYNNLRKQFGDADGRKYYQLLKDLPEEGTAAE